MGAVDSFWEAALYTQIAKGLGKPVVVRFGRRPQAQPRYAKPISDRRKAVMTFQSLGTNPERADTDGDGIPDGEDVENGDDPLVADFEEPKGSIGCSVFSGLCFADRQKQKWI